MRHRYRRGFFDYSLSSGMTDMSTHTHTDSQMHDTCTSRRPRGAYASISPAPPWVLKWEAKRGEERTTRKGWRREASNNNIFGLKSKHLAFKVSIAKGFLTGRPGCWSIFTHTRSSIQTFRVDTRPQVCFCSSPCFSPTGGSLLVSSLSEDLLYRKGSRFLLLSKQNCRIILQIRNLLNLI